MLQQLRTPHTQSEIEMNVITIAEIKRGGMAALTSVLNAPRQGGTATIMKRNRPAAIVLTPKAYEALVRKADQTRNDTALDWLLAEHSAEPLDSPRLATDMAQRLADLRADWPER
jgi:PHD/YefM family antitoxin component YafN of YafNO toxin-antitoxin module